MRSLCVLAIASGCSFSGVRGPTGPHPDECTDTMELPMADLAVGALVGIGAGAIVYAVQGDHMCNPEALFSSADCGRTVIAVGGGTLAALPWLLSSAWGRSKVRACRERQEAEDHAPSPPFDPPEVQTSPPPRAAPPVPASTARSLRDTADAAMTQGRFADAARDYSAAYEATHDPQLLLPLGDAHAQAHECGIARGYYERYLDEARPAAEIVANVQQRIAACAGTP